MTAPRADEIPSDESPHRIDTTEWLRRCNESYNRGYEQGFGRGRGSVIADLQRMRAAAEAVEKLHARAAEPGCDHEGCGENCAECLLEWPCPTIRAIRGES